MEAIAKRANVSKETLYRWWHSKTEVILDILAERGQYRLIFRTGPLDYRWADQVATAIASL
jgi:AcrR family transcriptional regulator